jgi:hypothetical protein
VYPNIFIGVAISFAVLFADPALATDDMRPKAGGVGQSPTQHSNGFAVVGRDGTLKRGYQVVGVRHLGRGQYEVDFAGAVGQCAYNATIATQNQTDAVPGLVVVQHRHGFPNAVFVHTFSPVSLVPTNYEFHLFVEWC